MSNPTSYSLINCVKDQGAADNTAAWERLWSVYSPYVQYRVRKAGASENDIDDIAQDVFRTVSQRIGEFVPGSRIGCFRAWLGLVVRHRVADHYRSQNRSPGAGVASGRTDALREIADGADNPEGDTDEMEADQVRELYVRAVDIAHSEFDPKTVLMFRQAVADERATKDIAEEHGVSTAAVRMAKSRVLRRLQILLAEVDASDL